MEEKKLLLKANEFYAQHNYTKAIEHYKSAWKLDPSHQMTYIKISNCLRRQNKLCESWEYIEKSLEISQNYIIGIVEKSDILLHMNQANKALKIVNIAWNKNKNYVKSYFIKAKCLLVWNEIDTSLKVLNQAIELNESYFEAYFTQAIALTKQGYYPEGLQCADTAIKIYEMNLLKDEMSTISNSYTMLYNENIKEYSKSLYLKAKILYIGKYYTDSLTILTKAINSLELIPKNEATSMDFFDLWYEEEDNSKVNTVQQTKKKEMDLKDVFDELQLKISESINSTDTIKDPPFFKLPAYYNNNKNNSNNNVNNKSNYNNELSSSEEGINRNNMTLNLLNKPQTPSSNCNSNISILENSRNMNTCNLNLHNDNKTNLSNSQISVAKEMEYIAKAKDFSKSNNKKDAIEYCNKVLDINPNNIEMIKWKANCWKLINERQEALINYELAYSLTKNNKDEWLLLNCANWNYAINQIGKAKYYYGIIIENNPRNENALKGEAACCFAEGDYNTAVNLYSTLLGGICKNEANIHFNKGVCSFYLGKYQEALASYISAVKYNYSNPSIFINMAECEERLNNIQDSIKYYDQAINSVKNNTDLKSEYYYKKAFFLFENDKNNEAEQIFNKSINENIKNADAYCGLGLCMNKKKMYKEAITYFNKAINLNKANPLFYLYKGFTMFDMKNENEMQKCFDYVDNLINAKDSLMTGGMVRKIKDKLNKFKNDNNI